MATIPEPLPVARSGDQAKFVRLERQDYSLPCAPFFGAGEAFFVMPPIFTLFTSSEPSSFFQYDPLTGVPAVRSLRFAAAPSFVMVVLLDTLKVRVPTMKLLLAGSTEVTLP